MSEDALHWILTTEGKYHAEVAIGTQRARNLFQGRT